MSADLAIGVKVGISTGAVIAGLTSLKRSVGTLGTETQRLTERQKMLGEVLANPLRMSKMRVGELKREYDRLGHTLDKLRTKQKALATVQEKGRLLSDQRQELKGKVMGAAAWTATAVMPIKLAMDFESSMADVRKVVDFDTPEQLKAMEQEILSMTRTIPMAAEELAQIAAAGGQLGVKRHDLGNFTETVAKMSVAFDMSAEQAGESMAKLANVYHIPIKEIGRLGDAINHLSNSSPAKASHIVDTLGRVGGVAEQFGLTELQAASLSNAFISLGRSPEVAGTAINGMLTKLMTADKGGKQFQAALKSMGLNAKELKRQIATNGEQALVDFMRRIDKLPKENQMGVLVDMFGREYADDIAVLVGGIEQYEESIRKLKSTGADGLPEFAGSMDKEFAARSATTANNWQLLKNSLVETGITLGSVFLPTVNNLIDSIKPVIYSLVEWMQANPALTKGIIGFVAGLAAVKIAALGGLFAFNLLQSGILFFSTSVAKLTTSWMLTVMRFQSGKGIFFQAFRAVRALGRGFVAAWPMLKAFGHGLVAWVVPVFKVFGRALWFLIRQLPLLGRAFMVLGRFLLATPIGIALSLMAVAAYLLYSRWDGIVTGAKLLWQDLSDAVGRVCSATVRFFADCWGNIKAFFSSGIGHIGAVILNWSPLGLFYRAFAAVLSWFGVELPATFTQFGDNIIGGLWDGLKAKFEGLKAWFADKAAWFKNAFAYTNGIRSPSRVFKRFGGWMMEGLNIGLSAGAARPLATVNEVATDLQRRFTNGGALSADLAGSIRGNAAEFAAARQGNAGGITVHFNPVIHAPGGEPKQIQSALQTGLREFEMLFNRLMDERARGAY